VLEPTLGGAVERTTEPESTPPGWYVLAWTAQRNALGVLGRNSIRSLRLGRGILDDDVATGSYLSHQSGTRSHRIGPFGG
jgi:hypothetical protein